MSDREGRMTLLDLEEAVQRRDADIHRMFDDAGVSSSRIRRGYQRKIGTKAYNRKLFEAMRFTRRVYQGQLPSYVLREALSTADFPNLFGDIIDRQLLANYREAPQSFRNYCKISTAPDFRLVKRFAINYAEGRLPQIAQQGEYTETKLGDAVYTYGVLKYGKKIPFDWETMINDDLDALKDVPARFGRSARRTEEFTATTLFVDANGPITGFYNTANKNRIHTENGASSNNPVLSIQALQDAILVFDSMLDFDGEPIVVEAVHLVVPPGLRVIAKNILNGTEIWLNLATATTTPVQQQLHTINWMKGMVKLSVNYYIPRVATSANGNTSWFLFADPGTSRPALEMGFLRGHEEPEIFSKDPNAMRIGGGMSSLLDGDFDTDSIQYKVRHCLGGVSIDPRASVASNGSGS
jgi:hypothetical protein